LLFKVVTTENQLDINVDKLPLNHGALGERSVGAPAWEGAAQGALLEAREHVEHNQRLAVLPGFLPSCRFCRTLSAEKSLEFRGRSRAPLAPSDAASDPRSARRWSRRGGDRKGDDPTKDRQTIPQRPANADQVLLGFRHPEIAERAVSEGPLDLVM
jgi:hypothetical protein